MRDLIVCRVQPRTSVLLSWQNMIENPRGARRKRSGALAFSLLEENAECKFKGYDSSCGPHMHENFSGYPIDQDIGSHIWS